MGQPVAWPDSAAMHHGTLPCDFSCSFSASSSSRVVGIWSPVALKLAWSYQMRLLTLAEAGSP
jgi:hypothetical protein